MLNKRLSLFAPLTKINEPKRLIFGVATAEAPDRDGEICDYASTKPYYEKWSDGFRRATDGKSCGNLRAMHGKVAAGTIEAIAFNDEAKQIEIRAHVVDDAEWEKVRQGVYTGFSQGGGYVKRWPDPDDPKLTRYTANPSEISLVDAPCLPDAAFEIVKADGTCEMRKFTAPKRNETEDCADGACEDDDDEKAEDMALRDELDDLNARLERIEARLDALDKDNEDLEKDDPLDQDEMDEGAPRRRRAAADYDDEEDGAALAEKFARAEFAKAMRSFAPALHDFDARLAALESQPMPIAAPPRLARSAAPEKAQDGGEISESDDFLAKFARMSDRERSLAMIRLSQMRPMKG